MPVNWALGLPQHDLATDATNAIQHSQDAYQKNMAKSAMAALLKDPSNPNALAALAQADPASAMQFRQQQLQYGEHTHEQWAKTIGLAAKDARTPEQWNGIVDQFVAAGHPEAARLRGQFSPALRSAYMAQGGVQDDTHPPGLAQEFDWFSSLPPAQQKQAQHFMELKNPGMNSPVTVPYGAQVQGGGQSAPMTATGPNGQKIQLNPQSGQWEPVGGAGGNVSGGFP